MNSIDKVLNLILVACIAVLGLQLYECVMTDGLTDDAYYYMQTAVEKIVNGEFTFDGRNMTNGFHPLWEMLLVCSYGLFGNTGNPYQIYMVTLVLNFWLLLGSCLVLFTKAKKSADQELKMLYTLGLFCWMFLLMSRINLYFNGMESALSVFLVMIWSDNFIKKNYLNCGLLGALLVMSRLDLLLYFIIPVIGFYFLFFKPKFKNYLIQTLIIWVPIGLCLGIYMTINMQNFGHVMPINGVLKSSFPEIHLQWHLLKSKNWLAGLIIISVSLAMMMKLKNKSNAKKWVYLLSGVFFCFSLGFLLFQKWSKPIPGWYMSVPLVIAFAVFSLAFIKYFPIEIIQKSFKYGIPVAYAMLAVLLVRKYDKLGLEFSKNEFIKSKDILYLQGLSPDKRMAATDCGRVGFWAPQQVTNLDGLINNFNYQHYLKRGELKQYLKYQKIDYLGVGAWDAPENEGNTFEPMYAYQEGRQNVFRNEYDSMAFYIYSYEYMKYSDTIYLPKSAEIFRSKPSWDGKVQAVYLMFDLRKLNWK